MNALKRDIARAELRQFRLQKVASTTTQIVVDRWIREKNYAAEG